jgi:hypothetical protein
MGFLNARPDNMTEQARRRRRLLRRAEVNGTVTRNVAFKGKSVRVTRERRPIDLTAAGVHGLLRSTGEASHGLAGRNYTLVQIMLQTGLRIGEVRQCGVTTSFSANLPLRSVCGAARALKNARCRRTRRPRGFLLPALSDACRPDASLGPRSASVQQASDST